MKKIKNSKKGFAQKEIMYALLAVLILVISIILYVALKDQILALLD